MEKFKRMKTWFLTICIMMSPALSYAGSGDAGSKLKSGMGVVIGLMYLIAFGWSITVIWQGVAAKRKGDPEAYNAIVAGLMIPAAILIVAIIFNVLGLGSAVSDASFDF